MNIGKFKITKEEQWVKLEDLIKTYKPDFYFVHDEIYSVQLLSGTLILCESMGVPNNEGYLFNDHDSIFRYVRGQGDLYIKTSFESATFNIGDNQ